MGCVAVTPIPHPPLASEILGVRLADPTVARVLVAVAIVVVTFAVLRLLDRAFRRREGAIAEHFGADYASALTRYRALRRIIEVIAVVVCVIMTLSAFNTTAAVAQALLASSAVLALVLGFAVRTPLANLAAGLLLAAAQPFRLGDRITAQNETGEVDEMTILYTVVRTDDNRRVYIPNEQLVGQPISNATIDDPRRALQVLLPASLASDVTELRPALIAEFERLPDLLADDEIAIRVYSAEATHMLLEVAVWAADGLSSVRLAADVRERGLAVLGRAGMLPSQPPWSHGDGGG